MKKHFCSIIIILLVYSKLVATPPIGTIWDFPFANYTASYQLGYNSNYKQMGHSLDVAGLNFGMVTYGYNYHTLKGHRAYIGLGLMTLAQIQIGYAFNKKDFLLRYRSDLPICFINWKLLGRDGDPFTPSSTIGFFCEANFNNGFKGYNAGVSLGISFWDIKLLLTRKLLAKRHLLYHKAA